MVLADAAEAVGGRALRRRRAHGICPLGSGEDRACLVHAGEVLVRALRIRAGTGRGRDALQELGAALFVAVGVGWGARGAIRVGVAEFGERIRRRDAGVVHATGMGGVAGGIRGIARTVRGVLADGGIGGHRNEAALVLADAAEAVVFDAGATQRTGRTGLAVLIAVIACFGDVVHGIDDAVAAQRAAPRALAGLAVQGTVVALFGLRTGDDGRDLRASVDGRTEEDHGRAVAGQCVRHRQVQAAVAVVVGRFQVVVVVVAAVPRERRPAGRRGRHGDDPFRHVVGEAVAGTLHHPNVLPFGTEARREDEVELAVGRRIREGDEPRVEGRVDHRVAQRSAAAVAEDNDDGIAVFAEGDVLFAVAVRVADRHGEYVRVGAALEHRDGFRERAVAVAEERAEAVAERATHRGRRGDHKVLVAVVIHVGEAHGVVPRAAAEERRGRRERRGVRALEHAVFVRAAHPELKPDEAELGIAVLVHVAVRKVEREIVGDGVGFREREVVVAVDRDPLRIGVVDDDVTVAVVVSVDDVETALAAAVVPLEVGDELLGGEGAITLVDVRFDDAVVGTLGALRPVAHVVPDDDVDLAVLVQVAVRVAGGEDVAGQVDHLDVVGVRGRAIEAPAVADADRRIDHAVAAQFHTHATRALAGRAIRVIVAGDPAQRIALVAVEVVSVVALLAGIHLVVAAEARITDRFVVHGDVLVADFPDLDDAVVARRRLTRVRTLVVVHLVAVVALLPHLLLSVAARGTVRGRDARRGLVGRGLRDHRSTGRTGAAGHRDHDDVVIVTDVDALRDGRSAVCSLVEIHPLAVAEPDHVGVVVDPRHGDRVQGRDGLDVDGPELLVARRDGDFARLDAPDRVRPASVPQDDARRAESRSEVDRPHVGAERVAGAERQTGGGDLRAGVRAAGRVGERHDEIVRAVAGDVEGSARGPRIIPLRDDRALGLPLHVRAAHLADDGLQRTRLRGGHVGHDDELRRRHAVDRVDDAVFVGLGHIREFLLDAHGDLVAGQLADARVALRAAGVGDDELLIVEDRDIDVLVRSARDLGQAADDARGVDGVEVEFVAADALQEMLAVGESREPFLAERAGRTGVDAAGKFGEKRPHRLDAQVRPHPHLRQPRTGLVHARGHHGSSERQRGDLPACELPEGG